MTDTKKHRLNKGPAVIEKINDAASDAMISMGNNAEDWVSIIIAGIATDYETELKDQADETVYVFKELMEDICPVTELDIRKIAATIAELRQKYRESDGTTREKSSFK